MAGTQQRSPSALLARLRGRSARELTSRGAQLLASELEYRGWSGDGREPDDASFTRLLHPDAAQAFRADPGSLARNFGERARVRFFAGAADPRATAGAIATRWPDHVSAILSAADAVTSGRFNLLGYEDLSFGSPIDWHFDPVHDRRAPLMHWSRIRYLDAREVGDHKIVWELNRHQHLPLLARAYLLSGEERYAAAVAEQVTSWIEANPPKLGINWASSLEVAYRAIAWLWTLALLEDCGVLTDALRTRMARLLYVHARHLERFLSTYFSPNTHLTGEALGLFYLGLMLPEFRGAQQWRDLGWSVLLAQLPRQVSEDGVYFEQSTYYQRYTVDIYVHAVLLARANGLDIPGATLNRLERAVEHLAFLTKPDGLTPLVGDDDGGRVLPLEERPCADFRPTLSTAAVLLGRGDVLDVAGGVCEETCWLLGESALADTDTLQRVEPRERSRVFVAGGCVILRDGWKRDSSYVAFDAGPHGILNCGHAHADSLSVEVALRGRTVFVDPGTFTYTTSQDERNRFRSSSAHNTLTIDQASWPTPALPFHWRNLTTTRLEKWSLSDDVDQCTGVHTGIESRGDAVTHRRTAALVKDAGCVLLRDVIEAKADHDVTAHFHCAPGVIVDSITHDTVCLRTTDGQPDGTTRILVRFLGDVARVDWTMGWVSRCYGQRELAPVCHAKLRRGGCKELITVILAANGADRVSVAEEMRAEGRAVAVRRGSTGKMLIVPGDGDEITVAAPLAGRATVSV